jgi:thiol-disulfide isomerase/thioredoxin
MTNTDQASAPGDPAPLGGPEAEQAASPAPRKPTHRKSIVAIVLAALVALGAGLFYGLGKQGQIAAVAGDDSAATLLAVSLPDQAGVAQPMAQWKGKVLVVNFWATWCVPCREEMPEFVSIQRELAGKGVQFVGIAVDSPDKVEPFVREIGLNYPALIGGYGAMELSRTLGNRVMALPFTLIVNRDGNIAHRQLGPLKGDQLRKALADLV